MKGWGGKREKRVRGKEGEKGEGEESSDGRGMNFWNTEFVCDKVEKMGKEVRHQ